MFGTPPQFDGISPTHQAMILKVLNSTQDVHLLKTLGELSVVQRVYAESSGVMLEMTLPYPDVSTQQQTVAALQAVWQAEALPTLHIKCQFALPRQPWLAATGVSSLKQVGSVIGIASGKGGVGKSTTAVNLALALQRQGARVGLLDADIYGPSMPTLLNLTEHRIEAHDQTLMQPASALGLVVQSIGFFTQLNEAHIWRGPMASRALMQLIEETSWGALDYLLVDLPPGTGDVPLTLAQKKILSAAVVVSTPQDLALADARKGIAMFKTMKVPLLGLVENMSYYHCERCQHQEAIFGSQGGARLSQRYELPLLGAVPLHARICEDGDGREAGLPIVERDATHPCSLTYQRIAIELSMAVAQNCLQHASISSINLPEQ